MPGAAGSTVGTVVVVGDELGVLRQVVVVERDFEPPEQLTITVKATASAPITIRPIAPRFMR